MNARELYSRVARHFLANVPPGIPPEYLRDFLLRFEPTFTAALSRRLVTMCGPDKLVDGYERILGINTEPAKNGHLYQYLVGLKARCHPGNPSIRQFAVHWRYDGTLRSQKGRWIRGSAKTAYSDQPWKLWLDTSWTDASWNEEEAIRRFVEDHYTHGLLWWLEGKAATGPAADVDPLEEERTQLTDAFAIQYVRQWKYLAPLLEFDPAGLQRIREQRQREATAGWWRTMALPDPEPTPYLEPVQQLFPAVDSARTTQHLERLAAWGGSRSEIVDERCPDCDDRGWFHDNDGALVRCTRCERHVSDEAMAVAHYELGCDLCGWPAGGEEDQSSGALPPSSPHSAIGRRARLTEDWYDGLMWKHTFPRGLEGTIVDVDARGRAELNFDTPIPMSWREQDDDPGSLEGIYLPLALLDVEGSTP